ncbi:MAG: HEAT repeat domain-containing protein, partial [Acidobacteriota bacterium]
MTFARRVDSHLRSAGQRTLLEGASGSGKSFTLARFASTLCRRALERVASEEAPEWLPLWWPAPDVPTASTPLLELLVYRFEQLGLRLPEPRRFALEIVESGTLVVLLDDLQGGTAGDAGRRMNLLQLWQEKDLAAVGTIRPGFADELPGAADRLELQGLGALERWRLLDGAAVERRAALWAQRLARRPRLARALENPQIWSMTMTLAREPGRPESIDAPLEIYRRFVEAAGVQASPGTAEPDAEDLESVLELLAATAIFGQQATEVPLTAAETQIERYRRARHRAGVRAYPETWTAMALDVLPRRHRLVLRLSDDGRSLRFVHGSLAEYLAGRWLLRASPAELPTRLVALPQLAEALIFHCDLRGQSLSVDDRAELDRLCLAEGSPVLVESLLRQMNAERIAAISDTLVSRMGSLLQLPAVLRIWLAALRLHLKVGFVRQLLSPLWRDPTSGPAARWLRDALKPPVTTSKAKRLQAEVATEQRKKELSKQRSKLVEKGAERRDLPLMSTTLKRRQFRDSLLRRLPAARNDVERSKILFTITACGLPGQADAIVNMLSSGNGYVRTGAAVALGVLGDPAAGPALLPLLSDESPFVRAGASRSLGLVGTREAAGRLAELLVEDADGHVRSAAAIALGFIGGESHVPGLMRTLDDPSRFVRSAAAKSLGLLRGEEATTRLERMVDEDPDTRTQDSAVWALGLVGSGGSDRLIKRLSLEDPFSRGAAARSLGWREERNAVPHLCRLLDVANEKDPINRGSAATALGQIGDPIAVDPLVKVLDPAKEKDSVVRGSAATALGQTGDPSAIAYLLPVLDPLKEKDSVTRGSAARALGRIGSPGAVRSLLPVLDPSREKDSVTRRSAATALGQIGDSSAVGALVSMLDPSREPDSVARGCAATALGQLGDPTAAEALLFLLDARREENSINRAIAATALGQLGDPAAVRSLVSVLDPDNEESAAVRGSAATALGQLGDPSAVEALVCALNPENEEDTAVRGSAATALGHIGDVASIGALMLKLDSENEKNAAVRGGAATALGHLGDPAAVGALVSRLDPRKEKGADARGSAVTALGQLG